VLEQRLREYTGAAAKFDDLARAARQLLDHQARQLPARRRQCSHRERIAQPLAEKRPRVRLRDRLGSGRFLTRRWIASRARTIVVAHGRYRPESPDDTRRRPDHDPKNKKPRDDQGKSSRGGYAGNGEGGGRGTLPALIVGHVICRDRNNRYGHCCRGRSSRRRGRSPRRGSSHGRHGHRSSRDDSRHRSNRRRSSKPTRSDDEK